MLGTAAPAPPAVAAEVFGDHLEQIQRYAALLAGPGVTRGLLGPREADRIWDRHLLNSAALSPLVPTGVAVADVGSGAGLPGIVLAVQRPDLPVTLIESLARRVEFLEEVVCELGLDSVRVVRGRAEELTGERGRYDVVTARAVAPLDRLVALAAPLIRAGGTLLAIKGAQAAREVEAAGPALARRRVRASVEPVEMPVGHRVATVVRVRWGRR